jgi:hypothetical protein
MHVSLEKLKTLLTKQSEQSKKTKLKSAEPKKAIFIYPVERRAPEKAWSVKLLEGIITPNPGHVKAKGCFFCHKTPSLVAVNYANRALPCSAVIEATAETS